MDFNFMEQKMCNDMIINNNVSNEYILNEECQKFAAREIDKRQKGTCPRLMLLSFCLFLSFELWEYIITTDSQIRIFSL